MIYTAHHDHLGVGEPDAKGDKIYNGAMDNASGVAQLLAIGKAFKALPTPPKRSIMLLLVAAEEQGLLGSKYYATHPTIEPGKIVANINYDGGNIWGRTKDIIFVGKGKSTIDEYVDAIAKLQGRTVVPDQFPDRGFFYRSDQFSFAKIGVPALYLDAGTDFVGQPPEWGKQQHEAYEKEHYHAPSDEIQDSWNYDGMIDDAQLGFYVGLNVANAEQAPTWVPGDEFEAATQRRSERVGLKPDLQRTHRHLWVRALVGHLLRRLNHEARAREVHRHFTHLRIRAPDHHFVRSTATAIRPPPDRARYRRARLARACRLCGRTDRSHRRALQSAASLPSRSPALPASSSRVGWPWPMRSMRCLHACSFGNSPSGGVVPLTFEVMNQHR